MKITETTLRVFSSRHAPAEPDAWAALSDEDLQTQEAMK